ncbi:hypothetical protein RND81_14G250900 [Saponaria officinalis]|uniref:Knottins-like domain-containing protein n=1 Tax=Saponaria officinalis TaxID=3572 RepID=A0AAW1GWS1_SAPOF
MNYSLFIEGAINEVVIHNAEKSVAEGQCERRSQTWSGVCIISGNCDNQCVSVEGAISGECQFDFPGRACFCKFC